MTLTYRSKLYVARENNAGAIDYGNPPAYENFDLIPFDTLNAMDDYEQILDQGLRGIAAMDFRAFQGVGVSNVSIESPFWIKEHGSFLSAMLGTPISTVDARVLTGTTFDVTDAATWRHVNDGTSEFNPENPLSYATTARATTPTLVVAVAIGGRSITVVNAGAASVAAGDVVQIGSDFAGYVKSKETAGTTNTVVNLDNGSVVAGASGATVTFLQPASTSQYGWHSFDLDNKSTWVMYEPRNHTFDLSEDPESLVFIEHGVPERRRWPGQRVSEISISYSSGEGALTASVTAVGLLSNPRDVPELAYLPDGTTDVSASVEDPGGQTKAVVDRTTSMVESWRGELFILDDSGNIVTSPPSDFLLSMDITLARETTPVHTARNDQSPLRIDPGRMECTGTLTLDYRVESYRNRYLNKEQDRFRLVFVRPEGYTVADGSLLFDNTATSNLFRLKYNTQAIVFDFGKVDWGESAFEVDRSDTYLMGSVGWRALYNPTFNGPVRIVLWNNRDDYLYNTAQEDLTA